MTLPTRTRRLFRQDIGKKFYRGHDIVISTTTSASTAGSTARTTLIDTDLSPAAESEDFRRVYIYVSTQPTAVDSTADMNDAGGISASDTSVTVTNGALLAIGDGIQFGATIGTLDAEIMLITNIVGNVLTITRAIQGTTAATHADALGVWVIGPAVGEVVRVTNVSFSGTNSQLTFLPSLSCRLQSGQEYELHYDFHPSKIHELLDEYLDILLALATRPVTLCVDGDMEATGTTDWTASVATLSKDTTTTWRSRQSLKVLATAVNGQARSTAMAVKPNTTLLVCALVYVTSGDSAKLTLLGSATSGGTYATIETAASAASGWVMLMFTASTTATQEWVKVYLESQADTDVTYWDAVIVWPADKFDIPIPSTYEYGQDIEMIGYYPEGRALSATGDDNAYDIGGKELTFYSHFTLSRNEMGGEPHILSLTGVSEVTKPLWLLGWKDYDVFASDSDTTKANKELVVQNVLADLLDAAALRAEDAEKHDLAARLSARANLAREEVAGLNQLSGPEPRGVVSGAFKRND